MVGRMDALLMAIGKDVAWPRNAWFASLMQPMAFGSFNYLLSVQVRSWE
jgi:hypothetical protein